VGFLSGGWRKAHTETGVLTPKSLIHDVFTFNEVSLSRQVLAPSANFTIVKGGNPALA
jgi:hypothetical protein